MTKFDETMLPSEMRVYNVKTIEMDMFKFKQLKHISSSIASRHLGHMVKALGEVLTNIDVNTITQGDFYYLLAYQRCHAYSKPVFCRWTCRNKVYRSVSDGKEYTTEQVTELVRHYNEATDEEKLKLENPSDIQLETISCDTHNSLPMSFSDIQVVKLGSVKLADGLDIPRANTVADSVILRQDPELGSIVPAALWVKEGNTLADKIEVLRNQKDLTLFENALEASTTIVHGIKNVVRKECTQCGSGSNHIFEVTPSLFFLV